MPSAQSIIEVRPIQTHEEYYAIEKIQRTIWGSAIVVPLNIMLAIHQHGGLVLGAFDRFNDGTSRLVGFVFSFIGLKPGGTIHHCSHMAGVLPEYQNNNVGYLLKCAQRDHVLASGYDLITWTFDPLMSRNGYFNLHKLGVICNTYLRNIYGPDPFVKEIDLPSDRFQVDWHIATPHVNKRLEHQDTTPSVEECRIQGIPLLNPLTDPPVSDDYQPAQLLIQIPADFSTLRSTDQALALAWRQRSRDMFESAFIHGYCVTDFLVEEHVYLLEKGIS